MRSRIIRFLLRLYPSDFRERYGREMLSFHEERVREGEKVRWVRIIGDHVAAGTRETFRSLRRDAAYALRGIARRPGFSALIIATIAVGIGLNAAIFSVVYGVVLKPLAFREADEVVVIDHKPPQWLASEGEFLDYKRELSTLQELAAYTMSEGNLIADGEPDRVALAVVTRNFFATIGAAPIIGRVFLPDEELTRPATVALISHSFWQSRFGGDTSVIGTSIELNGVRRQVIGVLPANIDFPQARTDIWLPMLRFNTDTVLDRTNHYLFMVARRKADATREQVAAQATALAARMMQEHAGSYNPNEPLTPVVTSVRDKVLGPTRPFLWAMLGAVAFIMLIVCVNVANLLLSRGEGRRKEMAIRTAMGATTARLTSQLLTESLLLACIGGAVGLVLALLAQRMLLVLAPSTIPRLDEIGMHWSLFAYTALLSTAAGLLFGLSPAIRASRQAPATTLKLGGSAAQHGSGRRVRTALVVTEVALAVVLLSGAGLLVRSLVNLQRSELGFDPGSTLTMRVSLPAADYSEERSTVFFDQLLQQVRSIPGVQSAAAAGWLPVVDAGGMWGALPEGGVRDNRDWPNLVPQQVTPDYFRTMGMRVIAGREFTKDDRTGGPYAAIITESGARHLWPEGGNALGRRFSVGRPEETRLVTVVGIVNDFLSRGYSDTPEPTMFFPYPQTRESAYFMPRSMSLIVRTTVNPNTLVSPIRAIVKSLDARVPISRVSTLDALVGTSISNRQFSTSLLVTFAALALLLAALGIYGVISHGVTERSFEIGVRMALGAEKSSVLRLVVSEGVRMTAIGVAIGLAGAAAVGHVIRSMLVGVSRFDTSVLVAAAALLILIAILASLLPARRAMAVNPIRALRE